MAAEAPPVGVQPPADQPAPAQPLAQSAGSARTSPTRQPGQRPPQGRPDRRPDTRRPDPRRQDSSPSRRPERSGPPTISDLLHEGQEILVQIAKEPIAKKGARITSHIALPGRLLVYMPTVNHIGVSRKIPIERSASAVEANRDFAARARRRPGRLHRANGLRGTLGAGTARRHAISCCALGRCQEEGRRRQGPQR